MARMIHAVRLAKRWDIEHRSDHFKEIQALYEMCLRDDHAALKAGWCASPVEMLI